MEFLKERGSERTPNAASGEDAPESIDFAAGSEDSGVYRAKSHGSISPDCASIAQPRGQPPSQDFNSAHAREWGFEDRRELRQQIALLDSYGLNQVLKIVYPGEPVLPGKAYTIDMANVKSSVCDAIDALLRPAATDKSSNAETIRVREQADTMPMEESQSKQVMNDLSSQPQPSAPRTPEQRDDACSTSASLLLDRQGSAKPSASQPSTAARSSKKSPKAAAAPQKKMSNKETAGAAAPTREATSLLAPVSSKTRKLPSRSPGVAARVEVQLGASPEWGSASVLATSSNKQLLLMDKDLNLQWMALKDRPHAVLKPQSPNYSGPPRVAGTVVHSLPLNSAAGSSTPAPAAPSQLPLRPPPPPSAVATLLRRLCSLDLMDHMPFWSAADEFITKAALEDEGVEEDLRALARCRIGHPLGTYEALLSPATCDGCHNEFPAGSVAFGCRLCNFDLCFSCGTTSMHGSCASGAQWSLQPVSHVAEARPGGLDFAQDVKGLELVLSRLERGLYHTPAHCLKAIRSVLASALACSEPIKADKVRYAAAVLTACFESGWQHLCDITADKAMDVAAANRRAAAKTLFEARRDKQKGSSTSKKPKIKPKAPAQLALEEAMALGSALGTMSARSLKVGDKCEARKRVHGKSIEWYAGLVTEAIRGFGYRVRIDDGDVEEEVPLDSIRVSSIALAAAAEMTAQTFRHGDAVENATALPADEEASEEESTESLTEPLPSSFLDHTLLDSCDCWPCYQSFADAVAGDSHASAEGSSASTRSKNTQPPAQDIMAAFDAPLSPLSGNLLGFDENETALTVPAGWDLVGAHLAIREGDQWFRGTVRAYHDADRTHSILFEFDGKEEAVYLDSGSVEFEIVLSPDKRPNNGEAEAQLWRLGKLVWARSMPHPWWPGELCVPSRNHVLNLAPPSMDQPSALVFFAGDGSYDLVNSAKYLSPFVVSRPRQRVDPQKKGSEAKAVLAALDEQLKRADELFMLTETARDLRIPKKRVPEHTSLASHSTRRNSPSGSAAPDLL